MISETELLAAYEALKMAREKHTDPDAEFEYDENKMMVVVKYYFDSSYNAF